MEETEIDCLTHTTCTDCVRDEVRVCSWCDDGLHTPHPPFPTLSTPFFYFLSSLYHCCFCTHTHTHTGVHGVCFASAPPALWNCTGKYARAARDCRLAAASHTFIVALLVLGAAALAVAGALLAFFWARPHVVQRLEHARKARSAGAPRAAAAAAEDAERRTRREKRRALRRATRAINDAVRHADETPVVATPLTEGLLADTHTSASFASSGEGETVDSGVGGSSGGSYAAPLCISQDIGELGRYTRGGDSSSEDASDPFNAPPEVRARLTASQQLHEMSAPLL